MGCGQMGEKTRSGTREMPQVAKVFQRREEPEFKSLRTRVKAGCIACFTPTLALLYRR